MQQADFVVGIHRGFLRKAGACGQRGKITGAGVVQALVLAVVDQQQAGVAVQQQAAALGKAAGDQCAVHVFHRHARVPGAEIHEILQAGVGHHPGRKAAAAFAQPEGGGIGRGVLVRTLAVAGQVGVAAVGVFARGSLCQGVVAAVHGQAGKFHGAVFKDGCAQLLQEGVSTGVVGVAALQGRRDDHAGADGPAIQAVAAGADFAFAGDIGQGERLPWHVQVPLARSGWGRRDCNPGGRDPGRLIIPKKGFIVPNMGSNEDIPPEAGVALGDALFSRTRQQVLALLFGQPDRSFYTNEILRMAGKGTGSVRRELDSLVQAGVLTIRRQGNQVHYQANRACPVFAELRGIVLKTFGVTGVLRSALSPLFGRIEQAFVYGSVAKGSDTANSDVDVLVVADDIAYAELMQPLLEAEKILGRTVHPTLYNRQEWMNRQAGGNAFVQRLMEQPRLWIKESGSDTGATGKPAADR